MADNTTHKNKEHEMIAFKTCIAILAFASFVVICAIALIPPSRDEIDAANEDDRKRAERLDREYGRVK